MFVLITNELLEKLKDWKQKGCSFWLRVEEDNYNYLKDLKSIENIEIGSRVFNLRVSLGDEAFTLYVNETNINKDWEKEIILLRISDFKEWYINEIKRYEEKYGKFEG